VGLADSAAIALRADGEAGGSVSNRKDEVGVVGNDVDDDEIYIGGLVGDAPAAAVPDGVDAVATVDQAGGAFYLYAPELVAFGPAAADEDEVEALAVAVGLGDSEAFAGGFVGEGEFGELSAALGAELLLAGTLFAALGVQLGLAGSLRARRWEASGRRAAFSHWGELEPGRELGPEVGPV